MASHMKTTIEIADPLLAEAKAVASREGTTLRALLEEGLRVSIVRRGKRRPFRLPDTSVPGRGPQPGVDLSDWETVRSLVYEERGG